MLCVLQKVKIINDRLILIKLSKTTSVSPGDPLSLFTVQSLLPFRRLFLKYRNDAETVYPYVCLDLLRYDVVIYFHNRALEDLRVSHNTDLEDLRVLL